MYDTSVVIKKTLAGAEEDEVADFKQALARRKASNANEVSRCSIHGRLRVGTKLTSRLTLFSSRAMFSRSK